MDHGQALLGGGRDGTGHAGRRRDPGDRRDRAELRDELLDVKILNFLSEARVFIETSHLYYDGVRRPHPTFGRSASVVYHYLCAWAG